MAKLCGKWDVKINSLWLWWYCLLVVGVEAYLIFRAVKHCKEYNELPWRPEEKPVTELYIYIGLIVLSIMCMPLFIVASLFKIGNLANDGVRLGRDKVELQPRNDKRHGRLYSIWQHVGPLCHTLHMVAAFTLLMPNMLLEAQEIKHGFLRFDAVWWGEMDIVLGWNRINAATSANWIVGKGNGTDFTKLYTAAAAGDIRYHGLVSPEFVNYFLATLVYSVRYPAVYWYTNMSFSVLFSLQLMLTMLCYLLNLSATSVLYKMQANKEMFQMIKLVLPSGVVIVLYLLATILIFFSSITIFNYGFMHYNDNYNKFLQKLLPNIRRTLSVPSGCHGYIPHTVATVMLVLIVACKAPLVYDYVAIYRKVSHPIMLGCVVVDVFYMLLWILYWFSFTLKQSWDFQIRPLKPYLPRPRSQVYTIQNTHNHQSEEREVPVPNLTLDIPRPNMHQDWGPDQDEPPPGDEPISTPPPCYPGEPLFPPDQQDENPSPPQSPTSAMKKNGEKKNTSAARVTFEEDVVDTVAPVQPEDIELVDGSPSPSRKSRHRSSKEGKHISRKRKRVGRKTSKDRVKSVNDPLTHPESEDRPVRRAHRTNSFNGFPSDSTPENTLTRNYRHSIRDKCGQYYRNSREFNPPPAAQSSPVLSPKVPKPAGDSSVSVKPAPPLPSGIPRSQNENSLSNQKVQNDILRSNQWPQNEKPLSNQRPQTEIASNQTQKPQNEKQMLTSPHILNTKGTSDGGPSQISSARKQNEPPIASQNTRNHNETPVISRNTHTQNETPIISRPARVHNEPPGISRIPRNLSPNRKPSPRRTPSAEPPQMNTSQTAQLRSKLPRPASYRNPTKDLKSSDRPSSINRDIRIMSSKPEMGSRDSALPSSNETSSNDSGENVLCSQV